MIRVLILGGDGYLGWPAAMHFSAKGHEVAVVDNYLRRKLASETDNDTLYSTPDLHERVKVWHECSGNNIAVYIGDLCDWEFVNTVFAEYQADTIIHFAEQPSAPYSMLNADAARLTISNNIGVTGNVVLAMKEHCPEAHLIKLGTMGEYGTPNIDIEEGWLDVEHKGSTQKFLYPRQAGSLYHTTKVMDTDLLWFYVRNWGIRVTELMQGPVYGIYTDENHHDDRLLSSFAYDEIFGTVINRFVVQAVAGYALTVYGKGGQTRGYLNIRDTLQCLLLAAENPADSGEMKIYNQFTETFSVNEIAYRVKRSAKSLGLNVDIDNIENPRKESEEHYYNPTHTGLLDLGLSPNYLTDDLLKEIIQKVLQYKSQIVQDRIFRGVKW